MSFVVNAKAKWNAFEWYSESANTACTYLESFLLRSQSFIFKRYTTPNVLHNFELISAVFASVKPSHVIKIMSLLFCRFVLNNKLSNINLNLYF